MRKHSRGMADFGGVDVEKPTCTEDGCDAPLVAKGLCRRHYQRQWKTGTTRLPTPAEHFLTFVKKAEGCWYWTGQIEENGYGRCRYLGRKRQAHCAAYELFVGPIPEGLELDHRCHTEDTQCPGGPSCLHRRCVNPAHLEPVGHRVNLMRGRTPAALNAAKTHCKNGHEFTPENTYVYADGRRSCRRCDANRSRTKVRSGLSSE